MNTNTALTTYIAEMRMKGRSEQTTGNNKRYCVAYLAFIGSVGLRQNDLPSITAASVSEYADSLWVKGSTDSTMSSMISGVLSWCAWLEGNGIIAPEPSLIGLCAKDFIAGAKSANPTRMRREEDD